MDKTYVRPTKIRAIVASLTDDNDFVIHDIVVKGFSIFDSKDVAGCILNYTDPSGTSNTIPNVTKVLSGRSSVAVSRETNITIPQVLTVKVGVSGELVVSHIRNQMVVDTTFARGTWGSFVETPIVLWSQD